MAGYLVRQWVHESSDHPFVAAFATGLLEMCIMRTLVERRRPPRRGAWMSSETERSFASTGFRTVADVKREKGQR